MSYIEFRKIEKYFGSNRVLKGIDLNVEKGQLATLLGPSGCGKSTLLRCLAGLEEVSSGNIYLDGVDITRVEPRERKIGMVFQQYSLFPNMDVYENIAFGLRMNKVSSVTINEKVKNAIEMVNLEGKEKSLPKQLSGGQQQRVALARSIVTEPKVLLLDEPLSAIDAKLRKSLQSEIRRIQQEMDITTVFVTHDQDEAMIMSDVIHLFNAGEIEQSGTPTELYTRPNTNFAASFIGNYNILNKFEFSKLVGRAYDESEEVAIRPETIELSVKPFDALNHNGDSHGYMATGKIIDYTARGNVLRYAIDLDGVKINADMLFRTKALFETGDNVYMNVLDRNCIRL